MATIKITRDTSLRARRQGRQDLVQLVPTPYPFAPKQAVRVTATFPPEPGPGSLFKKPRVESDVFHLPFMKAIEAAQKRWPGATIQIKTLGGNVFSACSFCRKEVNEREMVEAGRGPDGKMRRVCKSHDERVAQLVKADMQEAIA